MIAWGALCAVVSVAAAISSARRATRVERRLALLLPTLARGSRWRPVSDRDLDQSAVRRTQYEIASVKVVGLLTGAAIGGFAGNALGVGAPAAMACAYACFILPSLAVERRARARRRGAERATSMLLERLEALMCAGRPAETALAAVSRIASGSPLLDVILRGSADAYALGAPLFRSLAVRADAAGLGDLVAIAVELERSRDLGQGSVAVIREARDAARSRRRTRSLETAAKVEGKLMLTLVLCYLPALLLLVVIPLFLTLLDGLFG